MTEETKAPLSFQLRKIGHVVLNVADLEASVRFYTEVLGLQVSDRYPDSMVPGGMVFLRCNTDHHGIALVGGAKKPEASSLNHFAFEVGSVDEVFQARAWLRKHGSTIVFEGRRRAGCQIAVEFQDPARPERSKTPSPIPCSGVRSCNTAKCWIARPDPGYRPASQPTRPAATTRASGGSQRA